MRIAAIVWLGAWAVAAQTGKKPDPAAILDRYVEVTGGVAAYRKVNSLVMEITTVVNDATVTGTGFHARDGRKRMVIEAGGKTLENGVTSGVAWQYSSLTGARLLSGQEAEREIASAKAFLEDTWRSDYPTVLWKGTEMVEGKTCDHIRLTRSDGAVSERFFDKATGLQVRDVTFEAGEQIGQSVGQPVGQAVTEPVRVQQDVLSYETSASGIRYPNVIRITRGELVMKVKVESASFEAKVPRDAFSLPAAVIKAIEEPKSAEGLPNPVDLLEKYLANTGGKSAYQAVTNQRMTAEYTLATQGMKASMTAYTAKGGKAYVSVDLPGAGKFESGSDGTTAWENSVLLGPRLVPKSAGSAGMLGPQPDELMRMLNAYQSLQTIGKEEANGAPCYLVKAVAKGADDSASTMCFDVGTGLLTKLTGKAKVQMGTMSIDMILSDYREEGGIKMPHHMESTVSGQAMKIDITEVVVNGEVPAGTFDLPKEIRALQAKKAAGLDKGGDVPPDRPTLKRPH